MPLNKTLIEWVKNPDGSQGYTFNPITGCLNGCPYCYARKLANTRLKERYLMNTNTAPRSYGEQFVEDILVMNDPFYPRFWPERVRELAFHIGSQSLKGIFVCDMSDLFGIGIPDDWTRQVFSAIRMNRRHRFYLLTKQPQNLAKFSPFPDNCWVGVTATDQQTLCIASEYMAEVKASIKYVSIEPLLRWEISSPEWWADWFSRKFFDWVIIGAQTKPTVYPKIEWVEEIVEACDKAGIPVFLKNNLKPLLHGKEPFVGAIDIYPDEKVYELKLRQEMPG